MSSPMFSVTTDDARYYEWPLRPGHVSSITTVIKQGIPKPVLQTWAIKRTAQTAIENTDLLIKLKERASDA